MQRAGRILPLILMGLGVFGAVYLLFGEEISGGMAGSAHDGGGADPDAGFRTAGAGGLIAKGTERKRKTAEEKAAEEAKKRALWPTRASLTRLFRESLRPRQPGPTLGSR